MFDFVKIKLELILFAVLAALIGYFVWSYHHKDVTIEKLKTDVVVQKVENVGLKDQVQDQKASAVISEAVNVGVAKGAEKIHTNVDAIQKKTNAKIAQIEKSYQQQPATEANQAAEDTATSAALIDGMWDTYCAVKPGVSECSAQAPPANAAT